MSFFHQSKFRAGWSVAPSAGPPLKRLAKVALARGEAAAITELRLAVLRNGYAPIPCRDKRALFKGWNSIDPTESEVRSWLSLRAGLTPHAATGLLILKPLATIDVDIPDPEIAREVRSVIKKIAPQLFEAPQPALERGRDDGSPKFMLFCQHEAGMRPLTIKSRKWSAAPEDKSVPAFQVEIFASDRNDEGKARRQVGAFGAHTVDDESGEVRIRYAWRGPSPADVPIAALPVLTEIQTMAIADAADEILEARGMQALKGYRNGKFVPTNLYDLSDEMRFDGVNFSQITLDELTETYWLNKNFGDTRCSGSFTGQGGSRMDRCAVGWSQIYEHITIHDYATEITHRPVTAKPPESFPELVAAQTELKALMEGDGSPPSSDDLASMTLQKGDAP